MAVKAAIIIGLALVLVGAMIGFAAYENSTLAVIQITNSDQSLMVYSAQPSSTSSSAPTTLEYSGAGQDVYISFTSPYYATNPTIGSESISFTINGIAVSQYAYPISQSVGTGKYQVLFTAQDPTYAPTVFNTTIPFVATASMTLTGELYGSSSSTTTAYAGTATTYGEFTQSMGFIGDWMVSATNFAGSSYAPAYISNSSSITMSFNHLPAQLNFSYVENAGAATTNLAYVYIEWNGVKYNVTSMAANTTTVNGFTAFTIDVKGVQAGTYTVHGYIVGTSAVGQKQVQLMSIGMTLPGITPSHFTMSQIATFILAAILIIAGGIVLGRHLV